MLKQYLTTLFTATLAFSLNSAIGHAASGEDDQNYDKSAPGVQTGIDASAIHGGVARGPKDAAVTVVVFSDPQCSYCRKFGKTLDEMLQAYAPNLRIVMKMVSLQEEHDMKAEAALSAAEQGRFWPMYERLLAHQDSQPPASLTELAAQAGLDTSRFEKAMRLRKYQAQVKASRSEISALGIRGLPAVVIGDQHLTGARPLDQFRPLIERAFKQQAELR